MRVFRDKFRCVDREQLKIYGDYNSAVASQLVVRFKMCIGEGCESE